jgi:hypothetical protein
MKPAVPVRLPTGSPVRGLISRRNFSGGFTTDIVVTCELTLEIKAVATIFADLRGRTPNLSPHECHQYWPVAELQRTTPDRRLASLRGLIRTVRITLSVVTVISAASVLKNVARLPSRTHVFPFANGKYERGAVRPLRGRPAGADVAA